MNYEFFFFSCIFNYFSYFCKQKNTISMINYDLTKISTIIFDVDGVLSKNTIQMDKEGNPLRTVNIKDGYSMQLAVKMGLRLVIITGGHDAAIAKRYNYLGIKDVFLSCGVKIKKYREYLQENNITNEEVIYIGDDIPDYEIMKECGCPCCPKDACTEIRELSTYVSPYNGGEGCARDIVEQVLRTQGKWLSTEKAFGW